MYQIYTIKLDNGAKYQASAPDNMNLKLNDCCVIRKDYYLDYGVIVQVGPVVNKQNKGELPRIQRKATVHDKSKAHENEMRVKSALRTAIKLADEAGLKMNLLNAHYSFDGKLITFQFTADGRVDFRNLVKTLGKTFGCRIELRQIGVRDETAIQGGIGICGRPLCCCSFIDDFASINVKMAKEQDISLTPSSISGVCGRLKCCLKFEHEGYRELSKNMPKVGDICECRHGRGRVIDRNLLTQKVTLQLENQQMPITLKRDDIKVVPRERGKTKRYNNNTKANGNRSGGNAK